MGVRIGKSDTCMSIAACIIASLIHIDVSHFLSLVILSSIVVVIFFAFFEIDLVALLRYLTQCMIWMLYFTFISC